MSRCRYNLSEECHNNDCVKCILEKIKSEIENLTDINPFYLMDKTIHINRNEVLQIIDNHIAELKGDKECSL